MEKIFKAKRLDNSEWLIFGLSDIGTSVTGKLWAVCNEEAIYLDKNTICQYKGINDSEGNRIFEGDYLHDPYAVTDTEVLVSYCDDEHCLKIGEDPAFEWHIPDLTLTGHNIHDRG